MRQIKDILFWGLIVLYVGFGLLFISSSSFVKDGVRYFSLFDDAMISMRYARNFAMGHGLVWNAGGVPVEGYTNFLWTLYMALWHWLPLSIAKICLAIQLSGLAFLVASLIMVRKIAFDLTGKHSMALGACLLTAAYQPINFWALRGMETSVIGFIVLLATWYVFKAIETRTFHVRLYLLLGIGTLVRIDFAVLAAAIAIYMAWADPANRSKNIFRGLGIIFLFVGAMTLFRWFYYHDLLPNTYYLKTTGVPLIYRLNRGTHVMRLFIKNFSPFLLFLPGILYFSGYLKNKKVSFLLYLFLVQVLYSIWVGGDAWEWWGNFANRYLCIVMPCFLILLALFFSRFVETDMIAREKHGRCFRPAVFGALVLVAIWQIYAGNSTLEKTKDRSTLWEIHFKDDAAMAEKGLFLKELTTPQATIGAIWGGAIPYFSERDSIDFLGKSDPVIARGKNRAWKWEKFYPGHNKYDYKYSIGVLKPDVVAQIWDDYREAIPILERSYIPFKTGKYGTIYLRKDSKNVLWEKVYLQQLTSNLWQQVQKAPGAGEETGLKNLPL
jgi:arabinofuranosyltransferase